MSTNAASRRHVVALLAFLVPVIAAGSAIPGPSKAGGIVRGDVLEAGTSKPIAEVEVRLWNATGNVIADVFTTEQGAYRMTRVPAGLYMLEARRRGYVNDMKADVRVFNDRVTTVDFTLAPAPLLVD
jgi:hypothetical protein